MKHALLIGLIFLLIFSSCQKNNDNREITGSWKLIEVFDKTTHTVTYPPGSISMNIVITFLDANKFAGHTFRNTLTDGNYKQNGNEISFKNFSMTRIGEDQLGESFLTVLNACSLQSSVPCSSSKISIQGNLMKIVTPLRYDITLQRL